MSAAASVPLQHMSPPTSRTVADALSLISGIALASFVIAMLYIARDILIPLTLAALLTFLLAPLVTRLERWVGRIVAVLMVVAMIFAATVAGGWVLTRQLVDLGAKLPDYKVNIVTKLRAIRTPDNGALSTFSDAVQDLRRELPGNDEVAQTSAVPPQTGLPATAVSPSSTPAPTLPPHTHVEEPPRARPLDLAQAAVAQILGPLGTAGLVLLLVICMLLQREDLRSRFVRLVGQGHISATSRAMEDAGQRVSRYLLLQLVVNVTYGLAVAIGLYFIGVPNAFLWGGIATVLRFIPYIGPWIAASFPVVLSLAVSPNWSMPLLTIGLFVVLELLSNNLMEPWLYGSRTGVSPIALIVAAVCWMWLWGPMGLVLATPMTVCLVVIGRYVPRLAFLSVLLSDEEALTPAEDCYHRLLTPSETDEIDFIEAYLKTNSLTALYEAIFIPVITAAELDAREDALEQEQLLQLHQSLRDIIEDLSTRPPVAAAKKDDDKTVAPPSAPMPLWRVICLPARAERDQLAAAMLAHLLTLQGCEAASAPGTLVANELVGLVEKADVDVACISVVAPSTVIHARYLCLKLRSQFPRLKIVIGLWGATAGVTETVRRLRESGADEVVVSVADAIAQIATPGPPLSEAQVPAPICADEEQRLAALQKLGLLDSPAEPMFDHIVAKLSRIFDVPIVLFSLVDRHRVFFKSHVGLRDDLSGLRQAPRDVAVCSHVVANNAPLVVEDLARDRRFATNAWLQGHDLRFYAGVPLCTPGGQPIGVLSLLDTKPRQFGERELRHLLEYASEIKDELARRSVPEADALAGVI